jgi:hypothetical protein
MRHPSLSRRDLLQLTAAGVLTAPVSGWLDILAARAAEQSPDGKARHKACILLFMNGGPSHVDTFDPKPDNKTSELKAIPTAVSGIQVSEVLPKVAQQMRDVAVIHSMSTSEGSHGRARYYMHTGYREGVGGVIHPSIGAIVSAKLGKADDQLPNFVSVGTQASFGSGYLGPMHAPLEVTSPAQGIENLKPIDTLGSFDQRHSLLDELEKGFVDRVQTPSAQAHQATYQRAAQLMHSPKARAFDLSQEPATLRDAYGRNAFGDGCLLARRLVEFGVSFIEVQLGGWDTHRDNAARIWTLGSQLDPAMATLIGDLKSKGLLDTTLVAWMGDFGRTPTVGKQGGRDHYPRAWSAALAGAGIKAGQAIGRTDKNGGTVEDRPVSAIDFMATVCAALGIDYNKNFYSRDGRPMRIVDKGEKVITQLF